jgi:hypothetical protein
VVQSIAGGAAKEPSDATTSDEVKQARTWAVSGATLPASGPATGMVSVPPVNRAPDGRPSKPSRT